MRGWVGKTASAMSAMSVVCQKGFKLEAGLKAECGFMVNCHENSEVSELSRSKLRKAEFDGAMKSDERSKISEPVRDK